MMNFSQLQKVGKIILPVNVSPAQLLIGEITRRNAINSGILALGGIEHLTHCTDIRHSDLATAHHGMSTSPEHTMK